MTYRVNFNIVAALLAGVLSAAAGSAGACDKSGDGGEAAPSYQLGQGLRLGDSCATVGGYGSVQYQDLHDADARAALSHLSMFVWWENDGRLKFFSEFDSHGQFSGDHQSEAGASRYLAIERAYFDYAVSDSLTLRAGKYLTPIGRWNQVHADPLVWTTSRPLITSDIFPDNATGLMALGTVALLGRPADYSVYTSLGRNLRPDPDQDPFYEAYGARLNFPLNKNTQFGLSLAMFDQRSMREERRRLLGFDFLWSNDGYELSGEGIYRTSSEGGVTRGGFIQGVVPLRGALATVARVETLRGPDDVRLARRRAVLGLNYRSNRAVSLKLEFVKGSDSNGSGPVGVLSSVSVLF
jgi:hypothetical protein